MLAAALLDVALKLHHRQRGKNTARGDLRLFDQIVHLQRAVFQRAQNVDLVVGQPRVVGFQIQCRQRQYFLRRGLLGARLLLARLIAERTRKLHALAEYFMRIDGLVLAQHIPAVGETFQLGRLTFTVLEMEEQKIEKMRVILAPDSEKEAEKEKEKD